jgi:hypothetical protein
MMHRTVLTEVFPWRMTIQVEQVSRIAELLSASRPGMPHGSSFAITSDGHTRHLRHLWLSEASYVTINENHAVIVHHNEPEHLAMKVHEFYPSMYDETICAECGNVRGYTGHKQ